MSTNNNTYNGWTNYETWLVKLWLDNDEYLCNELQPELARQSHGDVNDLAEALREYVTDPENGLIPDIPNGLASDLLNAALSEVDWREMSESILIDHPQDEPETETEA